MSKSLPMQGTPKTLDEAILNAVIIGPMNQIQHRAYHVMRDFLAQKFGAAYLKLSHDPDALSVVEELFEELTKRPAENSVLKSE